jgi:hypothetical protein
MKISGLIKMIILWRALIVDEGIWDDKDEKAFVQLKKLLFAVKKVGGWEVEK